ncbi:VWA domain-containing protein [Dactylosporangium sp. AC04546]|uniref:VWA domain-containing protein n=1 Tax=Dactylosporangium sp. AC04546 TaxID=2862460 RepID=UPI001EDEA6DF|nr:VWA domain-containing protein [Dactylosporangium sp. AC04546]WVK78839.1 VWA domain-containing protein [Dactylosporangium sp. AC04546]
MTTTFTTEVYQNRFLPTGTTTVNAVVTVAAGGPAAPAAPDPSDVAQVLMVDCSGSMGSPRHKLAEAKKATMAAIDTLPDGVAFGIVAGRADATMVYPPDPVLAVADARTRTAAKRAVTQLTADGGTAIGTWLALANTLFIGHPAAFKHAILLTDGKNEHESPHQLAAALRACEGRFVCDSRGVGDDWSGTELRTVASALLGTADGLPDPAGLVDDFRTMTQTAMGKAVAAVSLRLWTPAGARIRFVKQVFPHVEDLTDRRQDVSARIGDYATGAWGAESRDFHVCVDVPAGAVGEERLAARVAVVSGDTVLSQSLVLAEWTDDEALSTRINARVAHYSGQAELAAAIQEGLAARDGGDTETATAKLGRAVQLAAESGHVDTANLLARVVDVVDARTGTVRLKRSVAGVDAELADVRSVKTIRVTKG